MDTVINKKLKWGVYESPQFEGTFERYVIEDKKDLKAFAKVFPKIKYFNMEQSMSESLDRGNVVIATDEHWVRGFPTWCLESKRTSTHPSSHYRINLGKMI